MRHFKPLLTTGAVVLMVTTACSDDSAESQDTTAGTAVPSVSASTEPTRESDGVLTIGVLLPQTGEGGSIGNPGIAAAEEAVVAINDEGGVLGEAVQLVRVDEGATVDEARVGVGALLGANVDAIVGPASSIVALDVLDDLMAAGVVTCSPTATSIALDNYPNRDLFFRTVPNDSLQADAIATYAQRTGVTAVTVVYVDDAYGRPFEQEVLAAMDEAGLQVTSELRLVSTDQDFADDAATLNELETGTIVIIADAERGWSLLTAMSIAMDNPPTIVVNDAMRLPPSPEAVSAMPEAFRTAIRGIAPLAGQGAEGEPAGPFANYSYDCVNLIALSALAAQSDDPNDIAANMRVVAGSGADCTTFTECAPQVAAGRNINYNGPSERLDEIGEDGDPSRGSFVTFFFDEVGLDQQESGPSRIFD